MNTAPITQGSAKQIAWAEQIRATMIEGLAKMRAKAEAAPRVAPGTFEVLEAVEADVYGAKGRYGSAEWWIRNRTLVALHLLREGAEAAMAK